MYLPYRHLFSMTICWALCCPQGDRYSGLWPSRHVLARALMRPFKVMLTLEPDYLDPVLALPLASDVNLGHLFKFLRP